MPPEGLVIAVREFAIEQRGRDLDDVFENQLGVMPIEIDDRIYEVILVAGGLTHVLRQTRTRPAEPREIYEVNLHQVGDAGVSLEVLAGAEQHIRRARRW